MSRRILLLLVPLLLAAAVPTHAQPRNEFAWQYMQSERPPGPPPTYIANMQPSARFPLTIQLRTDKAGVRGDSFVGHGIVHVFNPRGENLNFHYSCGIAFPAYRPREFYARWVTPGRKLEIALLKPGTNHTGTCRITTSPPTPNSSATANPAP
jgi:hypothetical protein